MWQKIVSFILRNRLRNIIVLGLLTAIMAFFATKVTMTYEMARMLPEDDPVSLDHQAFKKQFGEDGSIVFVGVRTDSLFSLKNYQAWYLLSEKIQAIQGITQVMSINHAFNLVKNDSTHTFDLKQLQTHIPITQGEVDSLAKAIENLPFYEGFLINHETAATTMMIFFDNHKLMSKERDALSHQIHDLCENFSAETGIQTYLSGLPYIRTVTSEKIQSELFLFLFLAVIVAACSLFAFFRSWQCVVFPILIVLVTVVWALGFMGIMGYQVTVLSAMIPPLLIVIGVENSIFLINKYHYEYKMHNSKMLALSRAISRIGKANILTNLTTAIGFLAFVITQNNLLVEFGIIASVSIVVAYFLTLILLPICFSYLRAPQQNEVQHLENKLIAQILAKIEYVVKNKRRYVYIAAICIVIISIIGISKLKVSGKVVDDIPHNDRLYTDLMFFEEHFNGIMPLEIMIDTKKEKGIFRYRFIEQLDELQTELEEYPEFSKPLSLVEAVKFAEQAYYNGNPNFYALPSAQEMNFLMGYLPSLDKKVSGRANNILRVIADSSFQKTRISVQMKNIGTREIEAIQNDLKPKINEIFDTAKYHVVMTGASVVFLKGTNYLTHNLFQSLVLALVCISFLLYFLFKSTRMLLVALVTNIVPLLFTAGMMGFLNIPIKMSSILVFSIALGISVDNTIHFLSRYRLELKINQQHIKNALIYTLGEAGFSMIYSSIILFLGFSLFSFSTFDGIKIVGLLVAQTLLMALVSNLFLLPSLLLWMHRWTIKKKRQKHQHLLSQENKTKS